MCIENAQPDNIKYNKTLLFSALIVTNWERKNAGTHNKSPHNNTKYKSIILHVISYRSHIFLFIYNLEFEYTIKY